MRVIIMIGITYLKLFVLNYIHRTDEHSAMLSKTQFIHPGLNYTQHSNTSVLQ